MTVVTASVAFNNTALAALGSLAGASGSGGTSTAFEVTNSTAGYQYDFTGAGMSLFFNGFPLTGIVTGVTVTDISPSVQQMYIVDSFSVTISGLVTAFNAGVGALQTLFLGGADTFNGSPFADVFSGLGGNDILRGKGGVDRLTGGPGRDTLNGGAAGDFFIFNAAAESVGANADTIQGFSHLQHDRIDLHTIDATPGGINNAFLFAGTQTFAAFNATHNGGVVRAVAGVVQVDIGGNGTVDMVIKTPAATLHAADFVL